MPRTPKKTVPSQEELPVNVTVVEPLPLPEGEMLPPLPAHPVHELLDEIELMARHGHTELWRTIAALVKQAKETL